MVTKQQQQQQQQHQESDGNGGAMGSMGSMGMSGQTGPGSGGPTGPPRTQSQYSIPGILHFLQHEWARFEMERSQWDVERAELQARIAFLQGERKGQENLKQDLVRRIKMLEHALKQERAKLHKLKYGVDLNQEELKPPTFESPTEDNVDNHDRNNSNLSWRQGRKLLRQYLEEIGYTDTIIDVRSQRVRSFLGLQGRDNDNESGVASGEVVNGNSNLLPQQTGRRDVERQQGGQGKMALENQEEAVLATFDFLPGDMDDEGDMSDEDEGSDGDVESEDSILSHNLNVKRKIPGMMENESPMEDDLEEESALAEFDFLTSETGSGEGHSDRPDDAGWSPTGLGGVLHPYSGIRQNYQQTSVATNETEAGLDIGELSEITIQNEPSATNASGSAGAPFRKTWSPKYTLRSHFDSVRSLCFHPSEPVLITASEDHTLKLWNLQKTVPAKKSTALDVEPIYTFRAHSGPVLALAIHPSGSHAYSGGYDSSIRVWNIPSPNMDPYDAFEPSVLAATLVGHTDAIWDLAAWQGAVSGSGMTGGPIVHRDHLLSVSADGTVKLWDPLAQDPLLNTFGVNSDHNSFPTSVDFIRGGSGQMVVGLVNAAAAIYDLETAKPVVTLESRTTSDDSVQTQINKIISHPSLPVTITAHEDRHIRFFDNGSGKMIHSMVAHLDAVTSLAVDPNGLYLLSGSHDCSIRLWNLDSKTCVQEITSHRKKFDESIFSVAFHPSKPFIASAGADALAKVFV